MWILFLITVTPTSVGFTELTEFMTEKFCNSEAAMHNADWYAGQSIYACLNEEQIDMIKRVPSVSIYKLQGVPPEYFSLMNSIRNSTQ